MSIESGVLYRLEGVVEHGRAEGRRLGFPTANLHLPAHFPLSNGVYICRACFSDGTCASALTNVGVHPTFEAAPIPLAEVYLLDETRSLYGECLIVEFLAFLRAERRFSSEEGLKRQVSDDIRCAKDYFQIKKGQ